MLNEAIVKITESLKTDERVRAIFLKGSFGRGEEDEYSDIDLYCLVDETDVDEFLKDRLRHLKEYGEFLFHEDIFIVAPQIIAVYENLVHVDLFTVTEKTYINKDYMKVLNDPENRLQKFEGTQNLKLSGPEFQDAIEYVAWFLFQYKKSADRGNDVWSVNMLHHVTTHLARVLLHRYNPSRAQLGLKALETSLPIEVMKKVRSIFEHMTPSGHGEAARLIVVLLKELDEWAFTEAADPQTIRPLWDRMIQTFY
ncbi:nucleotidyltransferase domain-containing protein [Chungangia koreensis]|uniref:Nucleotidyltransferase domain-containing protein n=1 Tax=Chungangia koreensis TaxID=752657 RepID=A0ABV8X1R9_9LACT